MFVNGRKIAKVMDDLFPLHRAYSWDNVGFQVGHLDRRVDRVLIALELTDAVIDEAISQGAEMIITHHPLIFSPLKRLCSDDPVGKLVMRLVEEKILLYYMLPKPTEGYPSETTAPIEEREDTGRVGSVRRPSKKELDHRANPVLKEEEQAMEETLGEILDDGQGE